MSALLALLVALTAAADTPRVQAPILPVVARSAALVQRGAIRPRSGATLTGVSDTPRTIVDAPPPDQVPPEIAAAGGPRGTSGEAHDDGVGYATMMTAAPDARWSNVAIGVGYAGLPAGTLVEITAIDSGRTIVALVTAGDAGGGLVALSPGAAQSLGVGDHAPVRVRSVVASPQDAMALRSGQAASPRLDAPPALLTALRRKLPGRSEPQRARVAATPRAVPRPSAREVAPATMPVATPQKRATSGYYVQVAALSSASRATILARDLGGRVAASGGLYRVQLGPFANAAEATRARDGAARRGYGDARILHSE